MCLFWQLQAGTKTELILQISMQLQGIICKKVTSVGDCSPLQEYEYSMVVLPWHSKQLYWSHEWRGKGQSNWWMPSTILKDRKKKVTKWNLHVKADKISWKLTFLLEMMVTSSRRAWKVRMLINQGSCKRKSQEVKLMRKNRVSNIKAVYTSKQ